MDSFKDDLPVLAVDGSKIQIPINPEDTDSFFPEANGQKPYNLLHLNALYNLKHRLYDDVIIQKSKHSNEHKAFTEIVDRSRLPKAQMLKIYAQMNCLYDIMDTRITSFQVDG